MTVVSPLLLLGALFVPSAAPGPTLAVMNLVAKQDVRKDTADVLAASLANQLRATRRFSRVTTASEVEGLLGLERQKQLLDCTAESCTAEIASALGVDYLAGGHVARVGTVLILNVYLVDVKQARVVTSAERQAPGSDESALLRAVPAVAQELAQALQDSAPAPAAALADKVPAPGETRASPLLDAKAVLACPPLVASGVEEPAGWLGAAAADVACRRATAILGGLDERTLVPAMLLDVAPGIDESIPADLYDAPQARTRAVDAAAKRAQAWLDGTVERGNRTFTVSLVLKDKTGQVVGKGSGTGRELHAAVRSAMEPLVATGAIPRAARVDPAVAPWANTHDPDALAALVDLGFSSALNFNMPAAAECERVARVLPALTWRAPTEATCAEVVSGTPENVPPPRFDTSTAAALAATAPAAARYGLASEAAPIHDLLRKYLVATEVPRERAALAGALLATGGVQQDEVRVVSLGAVQDDPRSLYAWHTTAGASVRQKGADVAARAFQAWAPEHPDAWNAGAIATPVDDLPRRIVLGRRAVVLSPDYPVFSTNLGADLVAANRPEEARTLAARLALGGPAQRAASEMLLASVEISEAAFGAALSRLRGVLRDVPSISRHDSGDTALVNTLLSVAVLLGRENEVADELAARYVLAQPPRLFRYQGYTTYTAGMVCLHSSKKVALPCVRRVRKLMAEGYFRGHDAARIPQLLEGLEKALTGSRTEAMNLWRPLGLYLRGGEMRIRLIDDLGDHDLAEQMDQETVEKRYYSINGASHSHVREALRAEKRRDKVRARALAEVVVKAWGASDADVPAVTQMRKLLARCK
jgi:TolB-like protein